MSWSINNPWFLIICLVVLLDAGKVSAETNALVLPPSDTRVIIDDEVFETKSKVQVDQLAKEEKLTNYSSLARHATPIRSAIPIPEIATSQLSPPKLAEKLRHSTVAIGLRYQPAHSKEWTYEIAATAFAAAPEILSTSLHVMSLDPTMMKEAQAVAVTAEGKVFPITEIVASSSRGDSCLVRAPGLYLQALPLRPGVRPGEPVWCMSHPDGFTYMFTSGQVARISRERYDKKTAPGLHVEVTAEYCPGSSGAAVTDTAGNVIAQVSSINQYSDTDSHDEKRGLGASGIVSARTCTAAEELIDLMAAGTNDPIPLPTPAPKKKTRAPKS